MAVLRLENKVDEDDIEMTTLTTTTTTLQQAAEYAASSLGGLGLGWIAWGRV